MVIHMSNKAYINFAAE